jgi:hypothetical protein
MIIINDNSRVINKLEASLTDNARVIIYDRHMFIVQATDVLIGQKNFFLPFLTGAEPRMAGFEPLTSGSVVQCSTPMLTFDHAKWTKFMPTFVKTVNEIWF